MSQVQLYNHIPFIKQPLIGILKEAIYAIGAVGEGIETYPICSYVLHSVFLKLTGAQEQKLKCICWELASRDYEYRYERYNKNPLGECSEIKEKTIVYNDLISEIKKIDSTFCLDAIDKSLILTEWKNSVLSIFSDSIVSKSFYTQFEDFKVLISNVDISWFMNKTQLLTNPSNLSSAQLNQSCGKSLFDIYKDYLYVERNRCAHNTRSYQNNLPYLKVMASTTYKLENYFLYISIIILLDMIFIKLFTEYINRAKEMFVG